MKKYRIIKPIMLGFLTRQGQYDSSFYPTDIVTLECDGHTIWAIDKNGERHTSITIAYAIEVWLREGKITEIQTGEDNK